MKSPVFYKFNVNPENASRIDKLIASELPEYSRSRIQTWIKNGNILLNGKTCLPKAKIASMSKSERKSLASAKSKAGKSGKYRRSSSTNVKGARKKGATLRDWFQIEDWRQVNDPSKKCGEK